MGGILGDIAHALGHFKDDVRDVGKDIRDFRKDVEGVLNAKNGIKRDVNKTLEAVGLQESDRDKNKRERAEAKAEKAEARAERPESRRSGRGNKEENTLSPEELESNKITMQMYQSMSDTILADLDGTKNIYREVHENIAGFDNALAGFKSRGNEAAAERYGDALDVIKEQFGVALENSTKLILKNSNPPLPTWLVDEMPESEIKAIHDLVEKHGKNPNNTATQLEVNTLISTLELRAFGERKTFAENGTILDNSRLEQTAATEVAPTADELAALLNNAHVEMHVNKTHPSSTPRENSTDDVQAYAAAAKKAGITPNAIALKVENVNNDVELLPSSHNVAIAEEMKSQGLTKN